MTFCTSSLVKTRVTVALGSALGLATITEQALEISLGDKDCNPAGNAKPDVL